MENLAATPRFGHTRDISVLFQIDGEDGDSQDYVLGLAVIAGIVAACFLFFLMIILIFMCCGKRRVGFLSGRPFEVMIDDEDYDSDEVTITMEYPKRNTTTHHHQRRRNARAVATANALAFIP